jgi:hypothetical protein
MNSLEKPTSCWMRWTARTKLAGSNKMELLLFSLGTQRDFRHQCIQGA